MSITGTDYKAIALRMQEIGLHVNAAAVELIINDYLHGLPEGCTPTDAAVLRRANHGLAIENENLRDLAEAMQRDLAEAEAIVRDVLHDIPLPADNVMRNRLHAFNHRGCAAGIEVIDGTKGTHDAEQADPTPHC